MRSGRSSGAPRLPSFKTSRIKLRLGKTHYARGRIDGADRPGSVASGENQQSDFTCLQLSPRACGRRRRLPVSRSAHFACKTNSSWCRVRPCRPCLRQPPQPLSPRRAASAAELVSGTARQKSIIHGGGGKKSEDGRRSRPRMAGQPHTRTAIGRSITCAITTTAPAQENDVAATSLGLLPFWGPAIRTSSLRTIPTRSTSRRWNSD